MTDGFEKVSNNVNDFISSDKPRNFFQKLADVFVLVIGFILKFFIILAGIFLLPPLVLVVFILVVVTFALLMGGAGFIYNLSPFGADLINGAPLSMAIMGCIGTILFIGIPIFSLNDASKMDIISLMAYLPCIMWRIYPSIRYAI